MHNTEYEVRGERAPIPAAAPVVGTAATTGGVSGTRAASAGTPYLVRAASTSTSSSGGGGGGASSLGSVDRHWEKSTSSDKAAATAVEADAAGGFNRKLEVKRRLPTEIILLYYLTLISVTHLPSASYLKHTHSFFTTLYCERLSLLLFPLPLYLCRFFPS